MINVTSQMFSTPKQMIPNTDYDLEPWEHVTCFKNVILAYEGDRSGLRGYLALGTTYWWVTRGCLVVRQRIVRCVWVMIILHCVEHFHIWVVLFQQKGKLGFRWLLLEFAPTRNYMSCLIFIYVFSLIGKCFMNLCERRGLTLDR